MSFRPDAKFMDDIAKMAGGAVNIFSGIRQQIIDEIKTRMDDMADRLDLVPREEFDRLNMRVNTLQSRLDKLDGQNIKPTAAKPKNKKVTPTGKKKK